MDTSGDTDFWVYLPPSAARIQITSSSSVKNIMVSSEGAQGTGRWETGGLGGEWVETGGRERGEFSEVGCMYLFLSCCLCVSAAFEGSWFVVGDRGVQGPQDKSLAALSFISLCSLHSTCCPATSQLPPAFKVALAGCTWGGGAA